MKEALSPEVEGGASFAFSDSARKAVFVLVPTGDPPSLRFGHPDVTSDDTAFSRWDTVRVRPRFPDAPSGCHTDALRSEARRSGASG